MVFNHPKPIFLQICDYLVDKVLVDEFIGGARVPSVRDLAVTMGVNPNTILRTYAELQSKGIFEQ